MPTQKNYAILEPVGAAPTLAPLYDVTSMFPYDTQRKQRKLVMSIGSEYNYARIELRHWTASQARFIEHAQRRTVNSYALSYATTLRKCPTHSEPPPKPNFEQLASWTPARIPCGNGGNSRSASSKV